MQPALSAAEALSLSAAACAAACAARGIPLGALPPCGDRAPEVVRLALAGRATVVALTQEGAPGYVAAQPKVLFSTDGSRCALLEPPPTPQWRPPPGAGEPALPPLPPAAGWRARVLDGATGAEVAACGGAGGEALPERVTCGALDARGALLALGDARGGVTLWDAASGALRATLQREAPPSAAAAGVAGADDDEASPSSSSQGALHVAAAAFTPDGASLLALYKDATLTRWDVASGGTTRSSAFATAAGDAAAAARYGSFYGTYALALSADGAAAATLAEDGHTVVVWRLDEHGGLRRAGAALVLTPDAARCGVNALAFSAARGSSRRLLLRSAHCVEVWDVADDDAPPRRLCVVHGHTAGCNAHSGSIGVAELSPDGRCLATGGADTEGDGLVRVWDARSGAALATLPVGLQSRGAPPGATTVAWSEDGARLAAAGAGAAVRVWHAAKLNGSAAARGGARPDAVLLSHFSLDRGSAYMGDASATSCGGAAAHLAFRAGGASLRFVRVHGSTGAARLVLLDATPPAAAGSAAGGAAAAAPQKKAKRAAKGAAAQPGGGFLCLPAIGAALMGDLGALVAAVPELRASGLGGAAFSHPLFLAAQQGHATAVALLLALGGDASVAHAGAGASALHAALTAAPADDADEADGGAEAAPAWGRDRAARVKARRAAVLELLLDAGADVAARDASNGFTPLHVAARHGNACAVRALLARGADVDAADRAGETALMWAAHLGKEYAAQALLFCGADATLRDDDGRTAADIASTSDLRALLRRRRLALPAPQRALLQAAKLGRPDLVTAALAAGADACGVVRDDDGDTPLHIAAASTSLLRTLDDQSYYRVASPEATIAALLQGMPSSGGGHADAPGEKGTSALCVAFEAGEAAHFAALLAAPRGADPNSATWKRGVTPLVGMAEAKKTDDGGGDDGGACFAALLAAGADVNLACGTTSPLLAAVRSDAASFARALLAHGADMLRAVPQQGGGGGGSGSRGGGGGVTPLGAARRAACAGVSAVYSLFAGALRAVADAPGAPPRLGALLAEPLDRAADPEAWAGDVAAVLRGDASAAAAAAAGVRTLAELNGALHAAIERGDAAAFAAALAAGADARLVEAAYPYGPLWVAVTACDAAMVRAVLAAGASLAAYDTRAHGILECAADARCAGGAAGRKAKLAVFQALLKRGADPNCGYETGSKYQARVALLHHLCSDDANLPLVRALLASGRCELDAADVNGATPLFWASRAPKCAAALVAAGADVWARNRAGALAWQATPSQGDRELPACDEDRARLKAAIAPLEEEPEESRRRRRGGGGAMGGMPPDLAALLGGLGGGMPPELAMLQGMFGGAWMANKLGRGRRGGGGSDSDD
jgi:ankyrin repeat protein